MSTTLNPDVQQALLAILNDIQSAKDFVLAETPQVLQQMVGWHLTCAWLVAVSGALLLIVAAVTAVAVCRTAQRGDKCDTVLAGGMSFVIIATAGGPMLVISALNIIKITHYPKWYLVETLTNMLS